MNWAVRLLWLTIVLACLGSEAQAQWWVGGDSYSLRVDKYDSFYGEARPIRWSVERPPGVPWKHMLAHKRAIHRRHYEFSGGYPAVYHVGYPAPYHAGLPAGDAAYYRFGYPLGHPVDVVARHSHIATWRPRVVQVDPLPGDEDQEVPYPAEEIRPPAAASPTPNGAPSDSLSPHPSR